MPAGSELQVSVISTCICLEETPEDHSLTVRKVICTLRGAAGM